VTKDRDFVAGGLIMAGFLCMIVVGTMLWGYIGFFSTLGGICLVMGVIASAESNERKNGQ
jgi:hypothetical protein